MQCHYGRMLPISFKPWIQQKMKCISVHGSPFIWSEFTAHDPVSLGWIFWKEEQKREREGGKTHHEFYNEHLIFFYPQSFSVSCGEWADSELFVDALVCYFTFLFGGCVTRIIPKIVWWDWIYFCLEPTCKTGEKYGNWEFIWKVNISVQKPHAFPPSSLKVLASSRLPKENIFPY